MKESKITKLGYDNLLKTSQVDRFTKYIVFSNNKSEILFEAIGSNIIGNKRLIEIDKKLDILFEKVFPKVTVKFNSDGGSVIENQILIVGEKATEPNEPLKEGFTFVEWQLDEKAYDFDSIVEENITLVAIWLEDTPEEPEEPEEE